MNNLKTLCHEPPVEQVIRKYIWMPSNLYHYEARPEIIYSRYPINLAAFVGYGSQFVWLFPAQEALKESLNQEIRLT